MHLYAVVFLDDQSDTPWAEVMTYWAWSAEHAIEQGEMDSASAGRITQVRHIPEAGTI